MTWWMIWFAATVVVVVSKWFFSASIDRLRRNLSRHQREAIEMKGVLADTRQTHRSLVRALGEKEANIKRMRSSIPSLKAEIEAQNLKAKDK